MTDEFLEILEDWFVANPTHPIRKTVKEMNVSEITIQRSLKKIGMVSKVQLS